MNFPDLLEKLKAIEQPVEIKFSPGPFIAKCNWTDAIAAKMLLWLFEQMPEDATVGNVEDVLISALWWLHFSMIQPKI